MVYCVNVAMGLCPPVGVVDWNVTSKTIYYR